MARIRSIKPEIRRSLTVGAWPRAVRLTWIYLWGYLDDEGRGLDDLRLIVAELYPLDRDVTERKIDAELWTIAATNPPDGSEPPLCRYTDRGLNYLHAVNWSRHQKISHGTISKFPPCPKHDGGMTGEVREPPEEFRKAAS